MLDIFFIVYKKLSMGFGTTTFLFFAQFCLPPATSLSPSRDSQMSLFPNHNTDPSLPDIIEKGKME